MKKQLKTVFLAAFLGMTLSAAAIASETNLSVSLTGEIPAERLLPRLVDQAELLTAEEETELLVKLDEISERQLLDVAVVTVNSLEGKTATEYADDTYDYNRYGYGEARDGILLLISMEERDWAMTTCGAGITAFTDAGQEYMQEQFMPSLSSGNYNDAFLKYAKLCDDFITQAKTGEPYDAGNLPKGTVSPFWIFGDLVIGCLIALGMAKRKKKRLKTVRRKAEAQDYAVAGTLRMSGSWDRMINRRVTTRAVARDSDDDSRSGGSTTHVSSSGTTHGGSSGKF